MKYVAWMNVFIILGSFISIIVFAEFLIRHVLTFTFKGV